MVYRSPDRREGQSQKSRDYVDAIIEFMDSRGYKVESRAEDFGEQEDIVFEPIIGRLSSVVAEAKSRDEDSSGFSPNDYKKGFAVRFREWEEGRYEDYEFHLFFEKVSNETLWKRLFDSPNPEAVRDFYEKIEAEVEGDLAEFISKHDAARFERFAKESVIWGGVDRADLVRITERIEETGEYNSNPYLETYEPVSGTTEFSTNLLQIEKLPESLYRFNSLDGTSTRSFYRHTPNVQNPIHYHDGYIYSLLSPEDLPEATTDFCESEQPDVLDFHSWATDSPSEDRVNIAKTLLRGLLVKYAKEMDIEVTDKRGDTRVFTKHSHDGYKIDNSTLTKELDSYEAVRHRAIVLKVAYFAGDYYYGLIPKQEFTSDGVTPVSGEQKKKMAADFDLGRFPQNRRQASVVDVWAKLLSPSESLARFNSPAPIMEFSLNHVEGLQLEGQRPPRTPDEREELVEQAIAPENEDIKEAD